MTRRQVGPPLDQKSQLNTSMRNPRKHARGIVVEVTCLGCGKTARVVLRKVKDALKLKCTECS